MENGTKVWNGMVRQLELKQVDICGATLTITEERSQDIDFTVGVVQDIVAVFVPNPSMIEGQAKDINVLVFFTVFTKTAWLGILFTAIVSSAVYALVDIVHTVENTGISSAQSFMKHFGLGMYEFFLSLIQRNSNTGEHLKLTGAKLLLMTTSAVSYILFTYYGGDLTATMTAGLPMPSIKSLQDILDSDYTFHMQGGTVYEDLFSHAEPDTVMHKLYKSKLETKNNQQYLKEQLEKPSKAVYFSSEFTFLDNDALFFVRDFNERFISQLALALQKGSDLTRILSYHISKLKHTGNIKKFAVTLFNNDQPRDMSHRIFEEEAVALGYENLFFPSLIMLVGISSSVGLVLIERLYRRPESSLMPSFAKI